MKLKQIIAIATLLLFMTALAYLPTPIEAQQYPRDQTLILGKSSTSTQFTAFDNHNPLVQSTQVHESYGITYMSECLFHWIPNNGSVVPWLGDHWEYGPGYSTIKIFLRRDVHWNDGVNFTAQDVVFSLNAIKNNSLLVNSAVAQNTIDSTVALDNYTVLVNLKIPNPRWHLNLAALVTNPMWRIVPMHIYQNVSDISAFKDPQAVFTGPYKLVSASQQSVVWQRDENYWAIKALGIYPQPKYLVLTVAGSPDQYALAQQNGDIDSIGMQVNVYSTYKASHNQNPQVDIFLFPTTCPYRVIINEQVYPLSIKDVRRAISFALNRTKAAYLYGADIAHPARNFFPEFPTMDDVSDPQLESYYNVSVFDPAEANRILDNLGFNRGSDGIRVTPNGTRLSFTEECSSPIKALEQGIPDDLKAIGIEVNVRSDVTALRNENLDKMNFGIAMDFNPCASVSPYDEIQVFAMAYANLPWGPDGTRSINRVRFSTPALDNIVTELTMTPDTDPAVKGLYSQALDIIYNEYVMIPFVAINEFSTFTRQVWTNWPANMGQPNSYGQAETQWAQFEFVLFNLVGPNGYIPAPASIVMPPENATLDTILSSLQNNIGVLQTTINAMQANISDLNGNLGQMTNVAYVSMGIAAIAVVIAAVAVLRRRKPERSGAQAKS